MKNEIAFIIMVIGVILVYACLVIGAFLIHPILGGIVCGVGMVLTGDVMQNDL